MTNKIDLKKVAGEALDEVSLAEHDLHYHDGKYRGGKCLFRERMALADKSDAMLDAANNVESRIYSGRRYERDMIEKDFGEEFSTDSKHGMRKEFLEPDDRGWNRLVLTCSIKTPDDRFDSKKVAAFFRKRGYEMKGHAITIRTADPYKRETNDKKVFTFDVFRPEVFQSARPKANDRVTFVRSDDDGEMSEERKNEALKKYGVKVENGAIRRRNGEDNVIDRAKKYLGIVGDWEGQSTREDAASGEWDRKLTESVKRAKEDAAKERLAGLI